MANDFLTQLAAFSVPTGSRPVCCAVDSAHALLAAGETGGLIYVYKFKEEGERAEAVFSTVLSDRMQCAHDLIFLSDAKTLVALQGSRRVNCWNVEPLCSATGIPQPQAEDDHAGVSMKRIDNAQSLACCKMAGGRFATTGRNRVALWSASGEMTKELETKVDSEMAQLSASPEAPELLLVTVYSAYDRVFKVSCIDVAKDQKLQDINHQIKPAGNAEDPFGLSFLISADTFAHVNESALTLYSLKSGKALHEVKAAEGEKITAATSLLESVGDGVRVALGTSTGAVRVYKVVSEKLETVSEHTPAESSSAHDLPVSAIADAKSHLAVLHADATMLQATRCGIFKRSPVIVLYKINQ